MTLKPVQSGDPLRIPASGWNDIVQATRQTLEQAGQPQSIDTPGDQTTPWVWAQNDSGVEIDRFNVLGGQVGAPNYSTPALRDAHADERERLSFVNQPSLVFKTPLAHERAWVALTPAKAGKFLKVATAGIVPVQVDVVNVGDRYATTLAGDTVKLTSHASLGHLIVHKSKTETGVQWCYVSLGGPIFRLTTMRIKTLHNDYLTCRTWDGVNEGSVDMRVAKPWKLRHVAANYPDVTSVTTTNTNAMTATGTPTEDVVIPDQLAYAINDVIYAQHVGYTGVTVASEPLQWIDTNVDARAWTLEDGS